ncbi:hypothetical protein KC853_00500 [Candidatus Saccharibacteria bacterium]|nr:hypothetical protein [Candidatus Saccharibacteria bacterium]
MDYEIGRAPAETREIQDTLETLEQVKAKYGEKCLEFGDQFIVNDYGKYRPNITFHLDRGCSGDSLKYRKEGSTGHLIISDLGLVSTRGEYHPNAGEVLTGDFWTSRSGKPHFRTKEPQDSSYCLLCMPWGHGYPGRYSLNGVDSEVSYFRRASSNAGGQGSDYYVVPMRPDWKIGFLQDEQNKRAKQEAQELQKAIEEQQSCEARDAGLGKRLSLVIEELSRLEVQINNHREGTNKISVSVPELQGSYFVCSGTSYLYTEINIDRMERRVQFYEELYQAHIITQEVTSRANELGIGVGIQGSLRFERVEIVLGGLGVYYVTLENYQRVKTEILDRLDQFETDEGDKIRQEEEQKTKLQMEAEAADMGLPQDIRFWKRTGGFTDCSMCWVIGPNGLDRERDDLVNTNWRRRNRYDEGWQVWNQILPGEVVLSWTKGYTAAPHEFGVIHYPEGGLTQSQQDRILSIQQKIQDDWAGRTGLSSDSPSPPVGHGWKLCGDITTPASKSEEVYTTDPVDDDKDRASQAEFLEPARSLNQAEVDDAIANLRQKFN